MENSSAEIERLRRLFAAVRKPGRECLYDSGCPTYKNNIIKQGIWGDIADEMKASKHQVQKLWKTTRQRYKMALAKARGQRGCSQREPSAVIKFLLVEMNFLQKFIEDNEPTVSSFIHLSDETKDAPKVSHAPANDVAHTSSRGKRKLPEETELEKTYKRIRVLAESLLKEDDEIDCFFRSLNKDLKTLDPLTQQELKIQFMSAVYAAKKEQLERNNIKTEK